MKKTKLYFEKFVEILNETTSIPSAKHINIQNRYKPNNAKEVLNQVKDSEIFVFSKKYETTQEFFGDHPEELDAPFRAFSIEMLDGPITSPYRNPNDLETSCEPNIYIDFIFCFETEEPKKFRTFALARMGGKDLYVIMEADLHAYVKEFINRINTEEIGTEYLKKRIKTGTGTNSGFNIKRIVHVSPKRHKKDYESFCREIDWSHRWMVRGHWRKISGIGKDRSGKYIMKGFTWISEHDKGPDGKPLIKKTRIVEES